MRGLARISALTFVAACGFSNSVDGNQMPIDSGIDGKMIDGPPNDIDADGVPNATDNCPSDANPMQFNEDADSRGDECDPCPQLGAVSSDVDDDGDKIGNGCDPRPSTAGDVLAYWNGFHVASAGLPDTLELVHGDPTRWSVAGGHLVFTRNADDWGMPVRNVGTALHTIDSTFDVMTEYQGASAAGVAVDIAANDSDLFECQARVDGGQREMYRRDPVAPDGWSQLAATFANTPSNDSYRITLQRTATDLPCRTTRLNQVSIDLNNGTDSLGNTRAGLFARNVDVRFRYLAVYTIP